MQKLQEALDAVTYREDLVIVYPGAYLEKEVVIEESRLDGLRIMSVPVALGRKAGYRKKIHIPRDERRLGPWYAPYGGEAPATATVTPTAPDPQLFPVIEGRLIVRHSRPFVSVDEDAEIPEGLQGIKHYDDEQDRVADGDEEEENADDAPEGSTEEAEMVHKAKDNHLEMQGLCFFGGIELNPLTRSTFRHCVFGDYALQRKDPLATTEAVETTTCQPSTEPPVLPTVVAHPLSEVLIEFCIIYGSAKQALYAYPRCSLQIHTSMILGPVEGTPTTYTADQFRAARHAQQSPLFRLKNRWKKVVSQPKIPTKAMCNVALYLDDADVSVRDCFIAHTDIGVMLVDGCAGTELKFLRLESHSTVGILFTGECGAAKVKCCAIRWCGRECILVKGRVPPIPPDAEAVERVACERAQREAEENENEEVEEEGEEEEDADVPRPPPIPAQHPSLQKNALEGTVRLEGDVSCGTMCDNVIYMEKDDTQPPLSGPSEERRFLLKGFHVHVRGSTPLESEDN
ncbi:hypothetical protein DPX39_070019100 [Trypanosoma brucei equiperdum]|nr:hypothetical protein DPX39_070019100 [Trypanosoma brucei equiperdum]